MEYDGIWLVKRLGLGMGIGWGFMIVWHESIIHATVYKKKLLVKVKTDKTELLTADINNWLKVAFILSFDFWSNAWWYKTVNFN
jgi:hypothetical protein